jgi:hypothetical protein
VLNQLPLLRSLKMIDQSAMPTTAFSSNHPIGVVPGAPVAQRFLRISIPSELVIPFLRRGNASAFPHLSLCLSQRRFIGHAAA